MLYTLFIWEILAAQILISVTIEYRPLAGVGGVRSLVSGTR